jgi:hypothetical protein
VTDGNYFRVQGDAVRNVRFENLRAGGKPIRSLKQEDFQVTGNVKDVSF